MKRTRRYDARRGPVKRLNTGPRPYAFKRYGTRLGYTTVPRTRGVYGAGEMKYFDTERDAALASVTTSWVAGTIADPTTFNTLCVPTVGAAINQRIGREVKVHSIKIRGTIRIPKATALAAAQNGATCRILLVQDKQTNAAQMTGAQLLEGGSAGQTTINSFQNLDNLGRFRVLKDKIITIADPNYAGEVAAANVVHAGIVKPFKIMIKFRKPVHIRFNAVNGGTVADIVDNSFHVVAGRDNSDLAAEMIYKCRVCYKE